MPRRPGRTKGRPNDWAAFPLEQIFVATNTLRIASQLKAGAHLPHKTAPALDCRWQAAPGLEGLDAASNHQGQRMSGLRHEIKQERPFTSAEEEALLNLFRTADCIQREFHLKTREWGISSTQYNVLRILRGALPDGLTCSEIGKRMITADPDITRLLARLRARKLVRQQRDRHDRRVLWTHISDAGLELLRQMDPVIQEAPKELLHQLDEKQVAQLTELLELARQNCGDGRRPPTCDGSEKGCES